MADTIVEQMTETQVAADLATIGMGVRNIDDTPLVIVPKGYVVHDLEKMLNAPTRKRGTITYAALDSFTGAVRRESNAPFSRLFVNTSDKTKPPRFICVFNDNGADRDLPCWRDHRAVYQPAFSPEWVTWTAKNGVRMNQLEFATFIEDNLPDIVAPESARVLEIAQTFVAKKKVDFSSSIRLPNGQVQLVYQETIDATAGKGHMQIPEEFQLGFPVFERGQGYSVTARLRYMTDGGRLALWFDLLRPHKIVEDAVRQIEADIIKDTGFTEILSVSDH